MNILQLSRFSILLVLAVSGCKERTPAPADEEGGALLSPSTPMPPSPEPDFPEAPARPDDLLFDVADVAHVDPLELLAQARAVARRANDRAMFTGLTVYPALSGGTVDFNSRPSPTITYGFEFLYFDKSKPAGKDKIQGTIRISASGKHFTVSQIPYAQQLSTRDAKAGLVEEPRCGAQKAWQAAVNSGMPDTAVAIVSYKKAWLSGLDLPSVWVFRVEGHDEMSREIDGATCVGGPSSGAAMTGRAAQASAARGPVQAPKSAPAAGSCGCRASDVLCAMKCKQQPKSFAPVDPWDLHK